METQRTRNHYFSTDDELKLHYSITLNSNANAPWLITLHGFGRTHSDFEHLSAFYQYYHVLGVDLFFHGQSVASRPMSKADWSGMIDQILLKHQINTFHLAAYSMGGKFALCLLEALPHRIEKVFLIAADGLKIHPAYKFATRTLLGQSITKLYVQNAAPFVFMIKSLAWIKVLNPRVKKFALSYMHPADLRKQVQMIWQYFKHIVPDLNLVATNCNRHQIKVLFIFGRFDFVVPSKNVHRFQSLLRQRSNVYLVNNGHHMFNEKTNTVITQILKVSSN